MPTIAIALALLASTAPAPAQPRGRSRQERSVLVRPRRSRPDSNISGPSCRRVGAWTWRLEETTDMELPFRG
jgi:hypothetical protein